MDEKPVNISAVDLFCGAGGLSYGLAQAGIHVAAGIDIEERARYAYETNHPGAKFLCWDITKKRCASVEKLFQPGAVRLLAGCAPCPPFSSRTSNKGRKSLTEKSKLLSHFGRLVRGIHPEVVIMENVSGIESRGKDILQEFLATLSALDYKTDYRVLRCENYGVPQARRRFMLLASKLGDLHLPEETHADARQHKTVRQTIGHLPPVRSGETDPTDRMHSAVRYSPLTLKRIQATPHDGGTYDSWPPELFPDRFKKDKRLIPAFKIHSRLWWDRPSATILTQLAPESGRLTHPCQDRAITSREAALLQTFPPSFEFWPADQKIIRSAVDKLIGNAVPPRLGYLLGQAIVQHVRDHT